MRREMTGGLVAALMLAPLLAGCGPDWQPSWNMSSTPTIPGEGLTMRRVAGEDAPFEPVRSQDIDAFMTLRRELFPKLFGDGAYPPNTLLIVDRLVTADFLIEVEAVAAVDR